MLLLGLIILNSYYNAVSHRSWDQVFESRWRSAHTMLDFLSRTDFDYAQSHVMWSAEQHIRGMSTNTHDITCNALY